MSRKYKNPSEVPTEEICKRLDEIVESICQGNESILKTFTMRIPAEVDYDPDIVISEASERLQSITKDKAIVDIADIIKLRETIVRAAEVYSCCNISPKDRSKFYAARSILMNNACQILTNMEHANGKNST